MANPSLALVAAVARALGSLRDRVVFIGGAISPLLQIEAPFPGPRPTDDVDAIAVTASYSEFDEVRVGLRERGFTETPSARHAHRWVLRDQGIQFDLVPAGDHFGASGNPWDSIAVESATESEIAPGILIRHVDAVGFLVLKLGAYLDRGSEDPFTSHDLEDMLVLIAARPTLTAELAAAPARVRQFVVESLSGIRELPEFDDLLHAHLGNVARQRADEVNSLTRMRLGQIAALG